MLIRTIVHSLTALGTGACLLGCGDEDRVLEARCYAPQGVFAAAFISPANGYTGLNTSNGRNDTLGTILRSTPGPERTAIAGWSPVYKLGSVVERSSYAGIWLSKSLRTPIETTGDIDGEPSTEIPYADINRILSVNTRITIAGLQRRSLNDPIAAINHDPEALGMLRTNDEGNRYLIVSSIAYAKGASLLYNSDYSRKFAALQTFQLEHTYFHIKYSCAPLAAIGSHADTSESDAPDFYFYTAVRFDKAANRAQLDQRPVNPSSVGSIL